MADGEQESSVVQLLDTPDLADVLETDRFKQFLDHVPIAVAVAELQPAERVVYANVEFERLTGQLAANIQGRAWDFLPGHAVAPAREQPLSQAITQSHDYLGIFALETAAGAENVNAWSNPIQDDSGDIVYRLVALGRVAIEDRAFEERIRDKDTLLRELQHRVKNNLQMITALIRIEARNVPDGTGERFDRLAGRVESLALLYRSLAGEGDAETIDLGVYLSQIASAVMSAHAVEGIHLNLQVDTWPVSINVAMPAGLMVNELLTNALKHAFKGREGGTITLKSLVDDAGCRVVVADDGIGLSEGVQWPQRGKLSAMIVQSLRQNAKARVEVVTQPGQGLRVTVFFARADALPAG